MSTLLGIDLGTSSVKAVVFAPEGTLKGVGMAEYPILIPRLGFAEQVGERSPVMDPIVADVLDRPMCQGTGEQAFERAGAGAAVIAGDSELALSIFNGYQCFEVRA